MKILITGAAGMIGSHAAEYYAKQGHQVIAYDNLMRSRLFKSTHQSVEYNWKYLERFPNIQRIVGDIRDVALLDQTFSSDIQAVIHAAGQPGVGYSLENPAEDYSINAQGTFNVMEAIRRHCPAARVVYCSTNKVYGQGIDALALNETPTRYEFADLKTGIPETFPVDRIGHTPYGASKYTGDLYVQEYAHAYKIPTAVFRMSCIYGTRQFGFEDQGWLAWFVICCLKGQPLTLYGDGKQVRDALFVEDLIQAYDRFIQGHLPHGVFNMGGGPLHTLSLLELLKHLETLGLKKPSVTHAEWRLFDQKVYISDIRHAQETLQWSPTVTVLEGLEKLVRWARDNATLFDVPTQPSVAIGQAPLVSVVIPAKNEESNLPTLLDDVFRVTKHIKDYRFEVLVVDDHSTDATAAVSQAAGAHVIANHRAGGKGNALITGFEASKGSYLIMMDADRSHRPEDIPSFLAELKKGHGLVIGSRSTGGSDEYTPIRTLGNVGLTALFQVLTGVYITDVLNGFKAFKRELFTRHRYRSAQFEIEIELVMNTLREGWTVGEFACHEISRAGGEAKSRVIRHGLRFFWKIVQMSVLYRAERLFKPKTPPHDAH